MERYSLDMFASFSDLTLNSNPLNEAFYTRSESEDSDTADQQLSTYCGPAMRNLLLMKSMRAFNLGKFLEAVYYETTALSILIPYKYEYGDAAVVNPISGQPFNWTTQNKMDTHDPAAENPLDGIHNIIERCKQLPKEWMVVQLCKQFNCQQAYGLKEEYFTSHQPLNITLFCYPRADIMNNEPINIQLPIKKDSENIYQKFYGISQLMDIKLSKRNEIIESLKDVTIQITNVIDEMKQFLGAWVVLLSGKAQTSAAQLHEKKIFAHVDKFCLTSNYQFTNKQIVLISLIARRLDLITKDDIKEAAQQISTSEAQYRVLLDFLKNLTPTTKAYKYYPCIMIIDEVLDFITWEMINPTQEFTRVSSLALLFSLYDKYKKDIKNGYLNIKVKTGNCVINPDITLSNMEARLKQFFSNHIPHWKCIYSKAPTPTEFKELHSSVDVFVYSGHGSGIQYFPRQQFAECNFNCVVFLFGCESVALKSTGLQSSARGAHLFYHLAMCPVVVGALNIITDLLTDLVSTSILASWISPMGKKKWLPTDMKLWTGTVMANEALEKIQCKGGNPNLLGIIASLRNEKIIPIRMRMTIVCRGLPVYNITSGKI